MSLNKYYYAGNKMFLKNIFCSEEYFKLLVRAHVAGSFNALNPGKSSEFSIVEVDLGFELNTLYHLKKHVEGTSVVGNRFLLRNKNYSDINMISIQARDPLQSKSLSSFVGVGLALKRWILSAKNTSKKFRQLLLLNPIKGGVLCYFGGTVGFMPSSQLFWFTRAYFLKLNIGGSKLLSNVFYFCMKETFPGGGLLFLTRLPFEVGKLSYFTRFRRRRPASKSLNFVFLSQKSEKKIILNNEKNKDNKKSIGTPVFTRRD